MLVIPEGLIESIPEMYALIQVCVIYLRGNNGMINCIISVSFYCFLFKYYRKSISFTTTMFLWLRCHHNCLRGQLLCSSSCHPSSEGRYCIASKVGFLNIYNIKINYGLTICNISISCCSTKNQITLHSCPRFVILNAQ